MPISARCCAGLAAITPSGSEFTAEDYFEAAERIENLSAELAEALRTIPEAGR